MTVTPGEQFWWNWWVNVAVAVATFAAAFVALFRDWIRGHLFNPKLRLSLVSSTGEATTAVLLAPNGEQRAEKARYYHLRASNDVRWPAANQVQVFITRLETPGPDGALTVQWSGEIPIRWKFQEIYPLLRTIGSAADCDLCSVVKDKWLELHPLIAPNNFQTRWTEAANFVVSLQARSPDGESAIQRIRICWDGKWAEGETEMTKHLVVKAA